MNSLHLLKGAGFFTSFFSLKFYFESYFNGIL